MLKTTRRPAPFKTFARALALSTLLVAAAAVGTVAVTAAEAATASRTKAEVRKAKRVVAKQVRAMAKAKRKVRALEKRIKADSKRLAKQRSAGARAKLRKRIAKAKASLRKARTAWRTEVRTHNKAMRLVKRADRLIARATARDKRAKVRDERQKARETRRTRDRARLKENAKRSARTARRFALAGDGGWLGLQVFGLRAGGGRTSAYGTQYDGGFRVPAIPAKRLPERFQRQRVRYQTGEKPGTVVVDTANKYLYYVMGDGRAMRYGIGVGRAGMRWSGTANVGWKRKWPTWTPPAEMIERQPKYAKWSAANGGMPGGLGNPLGARALYLMQNGKDTLYRLHGTPNWRSIGTAQSSGCIRLTNQDVIDLYERVKPGAKVIVR